MRSHKIRGSGDENVILSNSKDMQISMNIFSFFTFLQGLGIPPAPAAVSTLSYCL